MINPPSASTGALHRTDVVVAVDTGGTFTDLVARRGAEVIRHKVPSTPHDPSAAVVSLLAWLRRAWELSAGDVVDLRHGTTVATNALLERSGGRVVFVTNAGFEDLLALRRQNRPDLYALHPMVPPPLAAEALRIGVRVRRGPSGQSWEPMEDLPAWIARHRETLRLADSFAVCLLHAWNDGGDELRIGRALTEAFPGVPVSLSHQVAPVFREFGRACTVTVNAYVAPLMSTYLHRLAQAVAPGRLMVQGSSGHLLRADTAAETPVHTVLSGPAGGVLGAWRAGVSVGCDRLLTLDMGGTSTDVAMIDGRLAADDEGRLSEHTLRVPLLPIETIGAGGGSIAWLDDGGALKVGPQSAGAQPGPACYGRGGRQPTVTDAHVVLGRLPTLLSGAAVCDHSLATEAVASLAAGLGVSVEEAAASIVEVATVAMARACKRVSLDKGVDPRLLTLVAFGGAGGLHACEVADELGCTQVLFPTEPGVLSAEGISRAPVAAHETVTIMATVEEQRLSELQVVAGELMARCQRSFQRLWPNSTEPVSTLHAELRYMGQAWSMAIPVDPKGEWSAVRVDFDAAHALRYGYSLGGEMELVALHARVEASSPPPELEPLMDEDALVGPEVISEWSSTLYLPRGWSAQRLYGGGWLARRAVSLARSQPSRAQLQNLEVHRHRLASVTEQMGARLQMAAMSANIKERRDFSCALFDRDGQMLAHAAHIPVHLGSAPASVRAVMRAFPDGPPGPVMLNDPFDGGTHLPDVTVVSPVWIQGERRPRWYVANRAHHADVGGITPGSMPAPTGPDGAPRPLTIDDEGFRTGPALLDEALVERFARASRTPDERRGDLRAQLAANRAGVELLTQMWARHGDTTYTDDALLRYAERRMRAVIRALPDGTWSYEDALDDDGLSDAPVSMKVVLTIEGEELCVDLRDAPTMSSGPINAVRPVSESAVFYVLRALTSALGGGASPPANAGLMRPVTVLTKPGTVLDATAPAAVSSGNVETSQRLVDLLLGVFAQACPAWVPAASCGTMNNILMGGETAQGRPWVHYETIAGGAGGGPKGPGADAIQCHMTNTMNTPIEALEHAFPLRVETYCLRQSRSEGRCPGGRGVVRAFRFLSPALVTLMTERRRLAPWGIGGGEPGACGVNTVRRANGDTRTLAGKATVSVSAGDVVELRTPGGGAWSSPDQDAGP